MSAPMMRAVSRRLALTTVSKLMSEAIWLKTFESAASCSLRLPSESAASFKLRRFSSNLRHLL